MSGYHGPERRVHRVYVTRNTEYHLKNNHCVGVRDLRSGLWLRAHKALHRKLRGALRFEDGNIVPSDNNPRIGESLYFRASGQDLVTSVVTSIQRPARRIVDSYD